MTRKKGVFVFFLCIQDISTHTLPYQIIKPVVCFTNLLFPLIPPTFTGPIGTEFLSRGACNPGTLVMTDRVLALCPSTAGMLSSRALVDI